MENDNNNNGENGNEEAAAAVPAAAEDQVAADVVDDEEENEEVEQEEEDDDEEEANDDDEQQQRDAGVIEGGRAEGSSDTDGDGSNAASADITLYLKCTENFEDHPILRKGVTVKIGMGKNMRLSAVFERYLKVCNGQNYHATVVSSDLEFVHCVLLNPNDTAEGAALMKNDYITVRRDRAAKRQQQADAERIQREGDKDYFRQMRHALLQGNTGDVLLDCRGTQDNDEIAEEDAPAQSTLVRCHSVIVSKRCPWLGNLILSAREQQSRDGEADQQHLDAPAADSVRLRIRSPSSASSIAAEDDEMMLVVPVVQQQDERRVGGPAAAHIENDDDDSNVNVERSSRDSGSGRVQADTADDRGALRVVIPNHSPDVIRLLLEYLYTNRVVPFGVDAFVTACRTKPSSKHHGPVAPYPTGRDAARRWPKGGKPTVSFGVAMATIALAEEASMPRLSLMAEVAASKRVTTTHTVEALSVCESQKHETGNPLPRLRKAAMDVILRSGPRGVFVLPSFRRELEEKSVSLIPTILTGAMEAVTGLEKKKKGGRHHVHWAPHDPSDWQATAFKYFHVVDRQDNLKREEERRKRRLERVEADLRAESEQEVEANPNRKSLKRMRHHLVSRDQARRAAASLKQHARGP